MQTSMDVIDIQALECVCKSILDKSMNIIIKINVRIEAEFMRGPIFRIYYFIRFS